jgi:hypothetical protein
MARDPFISAVEQEIEHWPGVSIEWDRLSKHRKATFTLSGKRKFITLPSTGSDTVRGPKNVVTNMRSVLREIGAERREMIPGRRQMKEEKHNMAEGSPIRVGITSTQIFVTIPEGNELFERFVDKDHRPAGHWGIELRTSHSLEKDPWIAVVKKELPKGKKKVDGIIQGGYSKMSRAFVLVMSSTMAPGVKEKFGEFRSAPAVGVRPHKNEILIEVPKDRLPPILRGKKRIESLEKKEDVKIEEIATPLKTPPTPQEEIIETGQRAMEIVHRDEAPRVDLHPNFQFPKHMTLSVPERPLTVERCINFLNAMKEKKKNDLRFTIEEHGFISYIEKGGRR